MIYQKETKYNFIFIVQPNPFYIVLIIQNGYIRIINQNFTLYFNINK